MLSETVVNDLMLIENLTIAREQEKISFDDCMKQIHKIKARYMQIYTEQING